MIALSTSYEKFLQRATSQTLYTHETLLISRDQRVSVSMAIPSKIIIPPMNANLNFSKVPMLSLETMRQTASAKPLVLPTFFNWVDRNQHITSPPNQGKCGSCWAVAVASAVSDNFVTRQLTPKNPQLSPTYLLSCYPDSLKCGGGNPALCLQWIAKNGIAANADSFDYSWCSGNAVCSGTGSANTTPIPVQFDTLNQLIPGCPDEAPLKFFVNAITMPRLTPEEAKDPVQLATATTSVKSFLFTKGPAVTGFNVLQNFIGGNFTCGGKNPSNVYLEKVDYKTSTYTDTAFQYLGGHAVVVVGWGIAKISESLLKPQGNAETMVDVPYWIARNSWGTTWGLKGYFHIAQFPYNQKSQFDATVFVQESVEDPTSGQLVQQSVPTGGILFFDTNYFGYGEPITMESFYEADADTSSSKSPLPEVAL